MEISNDGGAWRRMTNSKRWFVLPLILLFLCLGSLGVPVQQEAAAAAGEQYTQEATRLQSLGLFQGTSTGFQLDRPPTRLEGAVMLVRILGKEDEAKATHSTHPFTDVPAWGSSYVGYLYETGITSGTSATTYGAEQEMSVHQYITFVLRALGYNDANGDFVWNKSIDKAIEVGLVSPAEGQALNKDVFLRGHVAMISEQALHTPINRQSFDLAEKLMDEGVFTLAQYESVYITSDEHEPNQGDLDAYTVLVYMNGSDLESQYDEEYGEYAGAGSSDLMEMMQVGSSDEVNVIIETGGTYTWANEVVDGERNQRWLVHENELEKLMDLEKRNIGDPGTLTDFLTWGVQEFPAENYALIFWNHGGGSIMGFGADEWFEGDSLTLAEMNEAMQQFYAHTGERFELVGFDACLMATIETAQVFSPYADYFVASEELEPGHGWNYEPILRTLVQKPTVDGAELGKVIVDGYKAQAIEQEQEMSITLSVTDLSAVDEVVTALEAFIDQAESDLSPEGQLYRIAQGRGKAEGYGSTTAHGGDTDMVDLADLAENLQGHYPEAAQALIVAIDQAVVYNMNSEGRPDASGLSIYFPYKDKDNFQASLNVLQQMDFSDAYHEFLTSYVSLLGGEASAVEMEMSNSDEFLEEWVEGSEGTLQITIAPDDVDRIAEMYSVLATFEDGPDSPLIFLGLDDMVDFDPETGILKDDFTGEWVGLNGHLVSMYTLDVEEEYTRYAIPIELNGTEVDLIVLYNWEEGTTEIIGAWEGIDEETQMPDKNLIKINQGDVITPLFYTYDELTDEEGYATGDTFTVEGSLELSSEVLPAGLYLYGFYISDFAQNESYSDFVEIELVD